MTRRTVVACTPALLGALDFGFLAVAAPAIAADLELGSAYAWLFSAGSLAYGAVVLPAETLVGRMGASRLLASALAVAVAGVIVLAAAGDVAAAVAGRVLFGAGTGAAAAPALVLLADADAAAFARMGGAIALGFSAGVLLGAWSAWRPSLVVVAALVTAMVVAAARVELRGPEPSRGAAGAVRLGAATAAAGAFLAVMRADPVAGGAALAVAAALALSGWHALRPRLPRCRGDLLVACPAAAATTMSGVGATVLLGRQLGRTPSTADDVVLALFGLATLGAVIVARRLGGRVGAWTTAQAGLAAQAAAVLAIAYTPALLAPAVALFGAGHVVANAGAVGAAMRRAGEGAAIAAGLYATAQYLAAGAGALIMLSLGDRVGMVVAAAIAVAGAAIIALAQRRAPTQPESRSA